MIILQLLIVIIPMYLVNPVDKEKRVPTLKGSWRTEAMKVMSWCDWRSLITLAYDVSSSFIWR